MFKNDFLKDWCDKDEDEDDEKESEDEDEGQEEETEEEILEAERAYDDMDFHPDCDAIVAEPTAQLSFAGMGVENGGI
jgi:hypothetical protein